MSAGSGFTNVRATATIAGLLPNATYHRGISYRVLEAYADRITDPIRRYFDEIGVATSEHPSRSVRPPRVQA